MPRPLPLLAALLLVAAPMSAQTSAQTSAVRPAAPATPLNWDSVTAVTVRLLSGYLKVNTTNPPGNELAGALYLKRILDANGIPARILDTAELGHGRANLYARLRGNGKKKAIALVSHIDVVPVTQQFWHADPFGGEVKDGYVWGRGALDMKGQGIVQLVAMLALKRSGVPLDRDIVFIGNADEEVDGKGAEVFVARHPDLLKDVEFLITEGGDNPVRDGKLEYYGVGIAEKRTFWQHLVVRGVASHASRPTKQNPVPTLVAALDRIAHWETPLHVTPGVEKYFHDISSTYDGRQRAWLADVRAALEDSVARDWILSDVYWNAILRNTVVETRLQGSNKTNVIPTTAEADIDVRLLPDTKPDEFLAELERVAGDTAVHFTSMQGKTPLENPIDTDLFHAIERAARERDPGALVTTPMLTGATDRPTYRKLGIVTYGVDPFRSDVTETQRGVHGNDERVSVDNLRFGVGFFYDILRYVQ